VLFYSSSWIDLKRGALEAIEKSVPRTLLKTQRYSGYIHELRVKHIV